MMGIGFGAKQSFGVGPSGPPTVDSARVEYASGNNWVLYVSITPPTGGADSYDVLMKDDSGNYTISSTGNTGTSFTCAGWTRTGSLSGFADPEFDFRIRAVKGGAPSDYADATCDGEAMQPGAVAVEASLVSSASATVNLATGETTIDVGAIGSDAEGWAVRAGSGAWSTASFPVHSLPATEAVYTFAATNTNSLGGVNVGKAIPTTPASIVAASTIELSMNWATGDVSVAYTLTNAPTNSFQRDNGSGYVDIENPITTPSPIINNIATIGSFPYRINASNFFGSHPSTSTMVTAVPADITGFAGVGSAGDLQLSWNESARRATYQLQRAPTTTTDWEDVSGAEALTSPGYTIASGADAGYDYRVRANNFYGNGNWSDVLTDPP